MATKKSLLITYILFFILIAIILVLLCTNINNNKNAVTANDPIENLVNNSLSIQYGKSEIDLNRVFTKEFIDNIDKENNFYKKNLVPFKIVHKNYVLKKVGENEFTVGVDIVDKIGRYNQVIHLVKIENDYFISNIEYDI